MKCSPRAGHLKTGRSGDQLSLIRKIVRFWKICQQELKEHTKLR